MVTNHCWSAMETYCSWPCLGMMRIIASQVPSQERHPETSASHLSSNKEVGESGQRPPKTDSMIRACHNKNCLKSYCTIFRQSCKLRCQGKVFLFNSGSQSDHGYVKNTKWQESWQAGKRGAWIQPPR